MGSIVHKAKRGKPDDRRESLSANFFTQYDQNTLDAVKNVKDGPTTNIELTISCQGLPKLDFFSQTDPRVYCFIEKDGKYQEYGKTEIIQNDPNPKFREKIKVPYNFEKNQSVKFEIYDVDEFKENESDKKELIGHVIIPLHEIVVAHNQPINKEIVPHKVKKNGKAGILTVRGTEHDESSSKIFFHIGARSFISKNELSLQLYVVEGQEATSLGQCEYIQNNKKGFDWPVFSIPSNLIPDEKTIVRFEVFERTKTKPKVLIGAAEVSLGLMLNYSGKIVKIIKEGFTLGELKIKECKRVTQYTFLNYVYGGAEISLIIAIDFTNSNKEPTDEKSLHYLSDERDNEYLQALRSIGGILQYYDSDKRIPLLGFGAKLPPHFNVVSHCFSLNRNFFDPEVEGLEEVINTYKESLKTFKLHGPTIFSEILNMAVEYANYESSQDKQKYLILLVLTDGDINDMQATMNEIVKAAELPLSILIIGVGDNEFTQMKVLDGDDPNERIISSEGKEVSRDIVQFVPFSKFKNNYEALARETLAEIPQQFLDYMQSNNILPNMKKNNSGLNNHEFLKGKAEGRKSMSKIDTHKIPNFLEYRRETFTQELIKLEMDPDLIEEVLDDGIPAPDVGLFVEMASLKKAKFANQPKTFQTETSFDGDLNDNTVKPIVRMKTKQITIDKERNIEAEKMKAKEESHKIIQKLLEERDKALMERKIDSLGVEYVKKRQEPEQNPEVKMKTRKVFSEYQDHGEHFKMLTRDTTPVTVEENVCLSCRENLINTVFMPCGHAALCQNCLFSTNMQACIICKQKPQYYMSTKAS